MTKRTASPPRARWIAGRVSDRMGPAKGLGRLVIRPYPGAERSSPEPSNGGGSSWKPGGVPRQAADGRRDCELASHRRRRGIIQFAGLGLAAERPDSDRVAPHPHSESASEARYGRRPTADSAGRY